MESHEFDLGLSFSTTHSDRMSDQGVTDTQVVSVAKLYDTITPEDKNTNEDKTAKNTLLSASVTWERPEILPQRFTVASDKDVSAVKISRIPKSTRFNTSWGLLYLQ